MKFTLSPVSATDQIPTSSDIVNNMVATATSKRARLERSRYWNIESRSSDLDAKHLFLMVISLGICNYVVVILEGLFLLLECL